MKSPMKKFTIAVTGDFGALRTHEKIRQWVENNGGTFALNISPDVTHLVCSKEHYKRSVTMGMVQKFFGLRNFNLIKRSDHLSLAVQQARKIKSIKIVTFDWLEDSLMASSPERATEYLLKRQVKLAAKHKIKQKKAKKEKLSDGG
ncbi:MAG: hypothetical protein Q9190_002701 [Brigantiaea leucoxantha]